MHITINKLILACFAAAAFLGLYLNYVMGESKWLVLSIMAGAYVVGEIYEVLLDSRECLQELISIEKGKK